MEKMFDDKYYEAEDREAKKAVKAKGIDVKLMKDAIDLEEDEDDGAEVDPE